MSEKEPQLPVSETKAETPAVNPQLETMQQHFANIAQQVEAGDFDTSVQLLAEHPDLLSRQDLWNIIRLKSGVQVSSEYVAFLEKIVDAKNPKGVDTSAMEQLRMQAKTRLAGQLRRDAKTLERALTMLGEVIASIPDDTKEVWMARVAGTAYYERGMSYAKTLKQPDLAGEDLEKSSRFSKKADDVVGELQAREANAYWVKAAMGRVSEAKILLREIVEETIHLQKGLDEHDELMVGLQNTQANASVNYVQAGLQMQLSQAAKLAVAEFPQIAKNPILLNWVK